MIKATVIALSALVAFSGFAEAAGTHVNSNTSSRSISGSTSIARSGSNRNSITNVVGGGNGGLNGLQAPSVVGPSLATASTDTCLGVISFGASGPGGGLSFGSSTEDRPCNARKNALLLNALGQKKAALQALCTDQSMYAVLAASGFHCRINPQLAAAQTTQQSVTPTFFSPFHFGGTR